MEVNNMRIKLDLPKDEFNALVELSRKEKRTLPLQIEHILKQKLEELGILSTAQQKADFYKKLYEKDGFMKDGRNTEPI